MTQADLAPLTTWLMEPLSREVSRSVDRLRSSDDVQHVALMPDVHLSRDVCIGAVVATKDLVYPSAVGGDFGCGMAAVSFDVEATAIDNEHSAAKILAGLYECVPANKHQQLRELPVSLEILQLSDARLQRIADREGRVQLGTLGRGNHFLELQSDQGGQLWVMIHSGSRAIGQAVMERHMRSANTGESGLKWLDTAEGQGQAYLSDVQWARKYAAENRLAMMAAVTQLLDTLFGIKADWDSLIHCDHNHVQREVHDGEWRWIHRKGAQSAIANEPGIVPGSMGAASFHTLGRGCRDALTTCSHGAGRQLSRTEARQKIGGKEFARQVGGLWYDHRRTTKLRDEAPAAYKDIRQVMKAQRDLTRVIRELSPLLTYKGV
ncbi:RtcB family protein [Adhaeretor mobilis]|uniref:3'-phosphate/5'-hydroxy nucleic acid ligase n=1 Tax=Adhaeretor mobilis TaxID=1930276 RepID=A0A517MWG1_9BACT|nr:RtcB family protein [Adhaeretor mobilis]QDS99214.1 RNA-splicing ligase RtcB [Adhaeretor mobilis]